MSRTWISLLIALLTGATMWAETSPNGYVVKRWDLDDGLPLITVKDILQASDGRLWLGTWDTISRFDGVNFDTDDLVNHPEIISGNTGVIMEDPNGDIWIGTSQSLLRWRDGVYTVYGTAEGLQYPRVKRNPSITTLGRDAKGVLWVGTERGLHRETSPGKFELISLITEGLYEPRIASLAFDQEVMWIGSTHGVFRKRGDGEIERVTDKMRVDILTLDRNQRPVLKVLPKSLMRLEEDDTLSDFGELNTAVITRMRNGDLWAGTRDSRVMKLSDDLREEPELILQMSGAELHTIYEDREGNVWLGASGTGLTCLVPRPFDLLSEALPLPSDPLGCLFRRKNGDLFLGTFGKGAYQLVEEKWEFLPYGKENYNIPPYNGNIAAINETIDQKELWVANHGGPIGRFRNGEIEYVLGTHRCRALCPGADQGMWLGTDNRGIFLVHENRIVTNYDNRHGLSNNEVKALALDHEGSLWVSTQHGLNRLTDDGVLTSYFREDGLGINAMRYLHVGRDGTVWIATGGAGLARYHNGRFDRITIDNGLSSNFPTCLLEDKLGHLWIGTTNGLCVAPVEAIHRCLNGETDRIAFRKFGKAEGISMPTIGTGFPSTGIEGRDGKLWFIVGREVLVFDPSAIAEAQPTPVSVNHVTVDGQRLPAGELITIPPRQDRFTVHYRATHLTNPESLRFRYLLEGYDHEWLSASSDREVAYSRLPPGRYRFQVASGEAANNTTITYQDIQVLPAWWQTWWSKLLAAIGIVSLAGLFYHWRRTAWRQAQVAREEFSADLIKAQEAERKRLSAELHDGLGQSLLVAKNQIIMARQAAVKEEQDTGNLDELSHTVSSTIEEVRTIAHALRPYELDRLGFTHAVRSMLDRLRESTSLSIEANVTPVDQSLSDTEELNLYRVLQEALNNAIKHAQATVIQVSICQDEKHIRLEVTDNGDGPGTEDKSKEKGMGLSTMAERMRLVGGKCTVKPAPSGGTQVTAELPYSSSKRCSIAK